jgi:hypothetical protein
MNIKSRPIHVLVALTALIPPCASTGADVSDASRAAWPQWRGLRGDGVADGANVPTQWSETKNIQWSVKLPGWGTSSPVVYGDRVFITSQAEEGGKKSLLTLAFHRQSGRELWRHDFGLGVNQRTRDKSTLAVNTLGHTVRVLIRRSQDGLGVRSESRYFGRLGAAPVGSSQGSVLYARSR